MNIVKTVAYIQGKGNLSFFYSGKNLKILAEKLRSDLLLRTAMAIFLSPPRVQAICCYYHCYIQKRAVVVVVVVLMVSWILQAIELN